jgi:diguanylate cyclase (GGDEF)-like protein
MPPAPRDRDVASAAAGAFAGWVDALPPAVAASARGLGAREVMEGLLSAALRAAGCERGVVYLRERAGAPLAPLCAHLPTGGAAPDLADPAAAPLTRLLEDAIRREHPLRDDVEVRGQGRRSALAIPLRAALRAGAAPGAASPLAAAATTHAAVSPLAAACASPAAATAPPGPKPPPAALERRAAAPARVHLTLGAVYLDRPAARPIESGEADRAAAVVAAAADAYLLALHHDATALDAASGCLARAELERALEAELTIARLSGAPLAVVVVGIDRFQEIVDARGRRSAEEAAALVARRLRALARAGDAAVRQGGGTVVLLLAGKGEAAALAAARRLVRAAALPSGKGGAATEPAGPLSLSAGVAVHPDHGATGALLLRRADQALFKAETERGGGAVLAWDPATPRYALGTEKLPGIATGDPQRDRRNVLLLVDAIAAVNALREREHLLSTILDMLVELADAERGVVFTPAAEGSGAAAPAPPDAPPRLAPAIAQDARKRRIPAEGICQAVVDAVARTHLPVASVEGSGADDPALERTIREAGLALVICVPLIAQERLVGVLYVDAKAAPREAREPDLVFFQALAREVAVALENVRLYEETERARREVEALNRKLAKQVKTQEHELAEAKAVIEGEIKTKYDYGKIVGKSPKMLEVYRLLDRITDTDVPVLIQGESGTGKELVAKAIHYNGPRARKRFVSVNCAAIAPTLLESELFGHVKGAFTGADRDKPGLFEQADQGTIFLDEVQDMPAQLQRELLRVLQEKEVRRVGGKDVTAVNVRIIAAANRDLRTLMRGGVFREDLYYRMAVVTIDLPPLRERKEDIPLIVDRHLRDLCKAQGRPPVSLEKSALRVLLRHEWPGNVRELHNVLERTLLMLDGDAIGEEAVALEVRDAPRLAAGAGAGGGAALEGRPGSGGYAAARPGSGGYGALGPAAAGAGHGGGAGLSSASGRLPAVRPGSGGHAALGPTGAGPGGPGAGAGGAGGASASGRLPAVRPGSGGHAALGPAGPGAGAGGSGASGRFQALRPGSGGHPASGAGAPGAPGAAGGSGRYPAARPGSGGHPAARPPSGGQPAARPGSGKHAALGPGGAGAAGAGSPMSIDGYDPALDPDLAGVPEGAFEDAGALEGADAYAAYAGAPGDPGAGGALPDSLFGLTYKDAAEAFKAEYIRRILATHQGNVTRASEQSGLFRSSFHKIMRKLDVNARELRGGGAGGGSGERRGAEET